MLNHQESKELLGRCDADANRHRLDFSDQDITSGELAVIANRQDAYLMQGRSTSLLSYKQGWGFKEQAAQRPCRVRNVIVVDAHGADHKKNQETLGRPRLIAKGSPVSAGVARHARWNPSC